MTQAGDRQGEFNFLPLEKVLYGAGCLGRLPGEVDRLGGRRALVITGRTLATETPLIHKVETLLGGRHAATYHGIQQHVPESGIAEAVNRARACQADVLISVGGGSPIDAAKAAARRLGAEAGRAAPAHIAIPTTLSAAEFSHLAGFTDETSRSKQGFADPRVTPRAVFLDPEMTAHTPLWLWFASGIRALDHAVETLYAPGTHPINDVLALQAIRNLFACLPAVKAEPENLDARLECQLAAWMSFFSPASVNAAAGLSHTIGKRIGATYNVPHGVTSCILLPHVMTAKAASNAGAARLAPVARALELVPEHASEREAALAAASAVAGLVKQLDLPHRLRDVEVPPEAFEAIARAAGGDSPQQAEVVAILRQAW
jgi:alcohol dehydrogenase